MPEWTGIADADRHLGRPFPLPSVALPLTRWVEVRPTGAHGVEVEWNLDDSREGARGRLALYAGLGPAAERAWDVDVQEVRIGAAPARYRVLALEQADPALRPAHELVWEADGLHLRLTAQGPWALDDLVAIGASIGA